MRYGYQTWSENTLMQVYGENDLYGGMDHHRSNVVNYVLLLPNLVRRIPDENLS